MAFKERTRASQPGSVGKTPLPKKRKEMRELNSWRLSLINQLAPTKALEHPGTWKSIRGNQKAARKTRQKPAPMTKPRILMPKVVRTCPLCLFHRRHF
ncbi:hypothetical protein CCHR01_19930 [Colletotrichum chrysophilum]|uniref:Uncharacterized protein n=1 Tax=Colletotrichum chrysophilum TaxID=1836956 RepID=A0AAD8ZXQ3_9PEZI|nr:hypothetical protein CCHR01_19930 [Colletotrichum chrysophilum]